MLRAMTGLPFSVVSLGTASKQECKPTTAVPLPAEIRLEIYGYLLRSRRILRNKSELKTEKSPLRDPYTGKLPPSDIILHDTAILRTSRTTYKEAVHILYKENYFRYSISSTGAPSSAPFHLNLSMMRHIHLDYNLNPKLEPRHLEPRHDNRQIDRAISSQLKAIAANCAVICTFRLDLIGTPANETARLQKALSGVTLTGPALDDVAAKVQDCLSLVSIAHKFSSEEEPYNDLRLAVAPDNCWGRRGLLIPFVLPRGVETDTAEKWYCSLGDLRRG